jgi:hypothetical protein
MQRQRFISAVENGAVCSCRYGADAFIAARIKEVKPVWFNPENVVHHTG